MAFIVNVYPACEVLPNQVQILVTKRLKAFSFDGVKTAERARECVNTAIAQALTDYRDSNLSQHWNPSQAKGVGLQVSGDWQGERSPRGTKGLRFDLFKSFLDTLDKESKTG